jgi:hypothetical protein
MTTRIDDFLKDQRYLRDDDLAALMGWNEITTRVKIARREVPPFIRKKRIVLFKYDDVRDWLEAGADCNSSGANLASADILGVSQK